MAKQSAWYDISSWFAPSAEDLAFNARVDKAKGLKGLERETALKNLQLEQDLLKSRQFDWGSAFDTGLGLAESANNFFNVQPKNFELMNSHIAKNNEQSATLRNDRNLRNKSISSWANPGTV